MPLYISHLHLIWYICLGAKDNVMKDVMLVYTIEKYTCFDILNL